MAAYCVRKISPSLDPVTGVYPGIHVDASTPEEAVTLYGALPGHTAAVSDQFEVILVSSIAFRTVAAGAPVVNTSAGPAVPPVGS